MQKPKIITKKYFQFRKKDTNKNENKINGKNFTSAIKKIIIIETNRYFSLNKHLARIGINNKTIISGFILSKSNRNAGDRTNRNPNNDPDSSLLYILKNVKMKITKIMNEVI